MSTAPQRARRRSRGPSGEERLDRIFGALSDRTRRALLVRLSRQAAKISDLAEPFHMSLPAVSKHLRVLERAGLVRRTIDGRVHRCSLDAAPLEEADEWLARYRVFWLASLHSLARFVGEDDR
jgi:DNA-binding transcriptional ArsR family regulator